MPVTETNPVLYQKEFTVEHSGAVIQDLVQIPKEFSIAGIRIHPTVAENLFSHKLSSDIRYCRSFNIDLFDLEPAYPQSGNYLFGVARSETDNAKSYDWHPFVSIPRDSPYLPDYSDIREITDDIVSQNGVYFPKSNVTLVKREVYSENTFLGSHYILHDRTNSESYTLNETSIKLHLLPDSTIHKLLPEKHQQQLFCEII